MDRLQLSLFTNVSRKVLFIGNNMTNQLSPGDDSLSKRENNLGQYFDKTSTLDELKEDQKFLISYANFTEYNVGSFVLHGTKLGRLNELFLKYLRLRSNQVRSTWRLEANSFGIATLAAVFSKSKVCFKPDNIWELFKIEGFLFNNLFLLRTKEEFEDWTCLTPSVLCLREICLFGEFLYACVMIGQADYKDPEMIIIREESTIEELDLVDDISFPVTPRFAMMIFIVFRNWSANGISVHVNEEYVNVFREAFICPPSFEVSEQKKQVHVAYCNFWCEEKITIQRMEPYFKKFLRYFSSELCQSHHFFGRQVIKLTYEMAFNLTKGLCDYKQSSELEHILLNVLEILHFFDIKKEGFEFTDFQDIPVFLETKALKDHFDCGNPSLKPLLYDLRSANSLLIAVSLFVDFLFFEDWKTGSYKIDFLELWGRLNRNISTRCEALQEFVATYHLFPFFEKSLNPSCLNTGSSLGDKEADKSLSFTIIDSPSKEHDLDGCFEF